MFVKITNGIIQKRHFQHERSSLFRPIVISAILKQVKVDVVTPVNMTEDGAACLLESYVIYFWGSV